jgi:hypothetical protein
VACDVAHEIITTALMAGNPAGRSHGVFLNGAAKSGSRIGAELSRHGGGNGDSHRK